MGSSSLSHSLELSKTLIGIEFGTSNAFSQRNYVGVMTRTRATRVTQQPMACPRVKLLGPPE